MIILVNFFCFSENIELYILTQKASERIRDRRKFILTNVQPCNKNHSKIKLQINYNHTMRGIEKLMTLIPKKKFQRTYWMVVNNQ